MKTGNCVKGLLLRAKELKLLLRGSVSVCLDVAL